MNKNKAMVLLLLVAASFLVGCEELTEVSKIKDGTVDNPNSVHSSNNGKSNETVNSWIYQNMNLRYYWSANFQPYVALNSSVQPDEFFNSLLYKHTPENCEDCFSWIQENARDLSASLGGVSTSAGFSYYAFRSTGNNVIFSVNYCVKNSPAEKAGIKRGDIITKINGVTINVDNYRTVLTPENLTVTLFPVVNGTTSATSKDIALTKAVIQNDPILHASVINVGGKKVGYFVYNQFIHGIYDSATRKTGTEYDDAMKSQFGVFKQEGISELVIDLRYNGGGAITSSELLSSLIVKNLKPGTLMNKFDISENYKKAANVKEGDLDNYWPAAPNNIGGQINRVYFLTSSGTASASELVINNLKPFMDVVLVGVKTLGKDEASTTIDDSANNYRWLWGLQPIVGRTVNALGQGGYGAYRGIPVNVEVADNILPNKQFGDTEETYLKAALQHMGFYSTNQGARVKSESRHEMIGGLGFDNPKMYTSDMFIKD